MPRVNHEIAAKHASSLNGSDLLGEEFMGVCVVCLFLG